MKRAFILIFGLIVASCSNKSYENRDLRNGYNKEELPFIDLYFSTDIHVLSASELAKLGIFIDSWRHIRAADILVEGHADQRASDNYNVALSSKRVAHVEQLLKSRFGVRQSIVTQAFGEKMAMAPGNADARLALDRRVRVKLLSHIQTRLHCPPLADEDAFSNDGLANLGCATQANRNAMLAMPPPTAFDVMIGAPDPTHAAEAIVRYRTDQVKEPEGGSEE
jgi:peptidoglycan-associated lipoprotein